MPGAAPTLSLTRRRAKIDLTKIYALTNFATANYLDSLAGGGEAGDAASGFGAFYLLQAINVPTTTQLVYNNAPMTSPFAGHTLQAASGVGLRGTGYRDTTNNVLSPTRAITSSDLGRLLVYGYAYDPAGAKLRAYAERIELGTGTAAVGYVPATGTLSSRVGVYRDASLPTTSFRLLGWVTYRGIASLSNLQALFDAIRSAADVPNAITGVTVTHRWSLRDTIAGGKHGYTASQVAPPLLADTITSASADAMARVGVPSVHVIDPTFDGRTSCGVIVGSTSSYLLGAVGAGPRGSAAGHWYAMVATLRTSASGANQYAVDVSSSTNGFRLVRIPSANDRFEVYCFGAVNVTSASANIVATDRDVPTLVLYHYDGVTHTVRLPRGIILSGAGGYVVPPAAARQTAVLSDRPNGTSTAIDTILYKAASGDVPLTAGEIDAMYTAWESQRTLVTPAAKTGWSIDIAQDVTANGGLANGMPATVLDRVGTGHLSRVGSTLVPTPRTERLWSYETTPIRRGFAQTSSANHYVSSFDDASSALGFWWALLMVFPSAAGSPPSTAIAGAATTSAGFAVNIATTDATAAWSLGDGSAFTTSAATPIAKDKANLIVGVWDQPNLRQRIYNNRAEVGTGTARTAYAPPTATKLYLGRSPRDTGLAGARTILGYAQGLGVPTLAQIQSLYDKIAAFEGMQTIDGVTTTVLVDVTADVVANGGTLPAALTNRAGAGTFAVAGTPVLTEIHSRANAW